MKQEFRKIGCLVLVFLFFMGLTQVTAAASINEGQWAYKKSHAIVGSTAGALTKYQMRFIVHYGSGTDSGEDVYCDSQCKTDFSDIRFSDSNGQSLDYWIETKTDADEAIFWVEINNIAVSPDTTTIWMYVGNPEAESESNGVATFIIFDDFSDGDYTNNPEWEYNSGIISVVDGALSVEYTELDNLGVYTGSDLSDFVYELKLKAVSGADAKIDWRIDTESGARYHTLIGGWGNKAHGTREYYSWTSYQLKEKVSGSITIGQWYNLKIISSSLRFSVFLDDTDLDIDFVDSTLSSGAIGLSAGRGHIYYDDVRVRQYEDPEPSHGEWGAWQPTEATGGGMCLGTIAISAFAFIALTAISAKKRKYKNLA